MLLTLLGIGLAGSFLYMGMKFYHSIDWEEPVEPSPDLRAMHKREAELLHLQEILAEAFEQGKITQRVVDEVAQYCDTEIQGMQAAETAWKKRRRN